jgi:cytochrome o ubiquinol oxidase operon protein cyoD
MNPAQEQSLGSIGAYSAGFVLSLLLTSTAFWLTHKHITSHHLSPTDHFMIFALCVLAITQLVVQLIFFFHLDRESKPRWNITALFFAATVVLILVLGSLWIMWSLDYHHGAKNTTHDGHILNTPQQTNRYIIQDEGIHE